MNARLQECKSARERESERERKRERLLYRCGPLSLISFQTLFQVVSQFRCWLSNNGRQALRKRSTSGRGTTGEDLGGRTKKAETRERLLEMAMLAMQRERMERLDVYDMQLGVKTLRPSSRDSSELASDGLGREPRHVCADQERVPDGADEADGNLNSSNPESGSDRSEAGLCAGETNASKKSGRGSGQDANDGETKNEGDVSGTGAGEQRG